MTTTDASKSGWTSVLEYASAHESDWSRNPAEDPDNWGIHRNDPPPWNRLLGPVFDRGPASGVVLRGGVEQCRWGTPERADLTFSIAKTYLALLAGIAFDQQLIRSPDEPVARSLPGIGFDDPPNASISWRHLLQQTSEWRGEVFSVSDQVDHYRRLSFEPPPPDPSAWPAKGSLRPASAPGTYWEYNDVRINQLSLALAHLFGQALPEVFEQHIARPLGLTDSWRWHGYDNSWITVDGKQIQSVPGGSHWGGGIQISALDQSRIAMMMHTDGQWQGRRILSAQWLRQMREPCPIAPFYGYLLWLNTARRLFPSAPEDTYCAIGAGSSVAVNLPASDTVVVARWIQADAVDGLLERIIDALSSG